MKPNEMRALAHAGMGAFIFIALATMGADLYAPFKTFLATTFGHHWVGKGVLSIVVFAVVNYLQKDRASSAKLDLLALAWRVAAVVVLSGAAIFGFFVWELMRG